MSKLQEKPSAPQKRTPSTSQNEISPLFSMFVGHVCPPGSGSGHGYRDPIESGSNPNPDPQHYLTATYFTITNFCFYRLQ
jgi:hypothetical protein